MMAHSPRNVQLFAGHYTSAAESVLIAPSWPALAASTEDPTETLVTGLGQIPKVRLRVKNARITSIEPVSPGLWRVRHDRPLQSFQYYMDPTNTPDPRESLQMQIK